jgi:hypothetical protein
MEGAFAEVDRVMPYYHRDRNIAYLAHPRTASTSTGRWLQERVRFERWGTHHGKIDQIRDLAPDALIVTTVRNPFDTLVSWALYQEAELTPEWLEAWEANEVNGYVKPGSLWWLHGEAASVHLRFERLTDDLSALLDMPVDLYHDNPTKGRTPDGWRSFYTPEARTWVEEHHAEELARYGYGWGL